MLTGDDVTGVRVTVTGARYTVRVRSSTRWITMMTFVTRLTELTSVAGRTPALFHVHRRLTDVVATSHGSRQCHVVDETET